MIQSMTGYGDAHFSEDGVHYAVEIRSLNNRYFKSSIKLPENLRFMEPAVDKLLRDWIQRGSVTVAMRVRNSSATAAYDINRAALDHYLAQIKGVTVPPGMQATVDLAALLDMPGVCEAPEQDEDVQERTWSLTKQMLERALQNLMKMRRAEGEALKRDLLEHCGHIRRLVGEIAELGPEVVTEYQVRLRDRVAALVSDAKLEIDKDTLIREVAIYADRSDVNEEIARLGCHLEQFELLCDSPEMAGRKLDFLAQEMLREVNTIGSKSNNATIARNVVDMKGCIDRLKEQVQNVE